MMRCAVFLLIGIVALVGPFEYLYLSCEAFTPPAKSSTSSSFRPTVVCLHAQEEEKQGGIMTSIGNFFQELDNFMDDASARRLGNGAAFYGKRKSSFYGKDDKNKKLDAFKPDPTEDFQVQSGGYFKWMPDSEGQMRPVTRMKNINVERDPSFWDKVYSKDETDTKKAK